MLKQAEALFKAAGDRTRLRILKLLEQSPLCVCQIVEILGLSQSAVSKHLSLLSGAGLIDDEHQGRWTFYRLAKARTPETRLLLRAVHGCASDDPQVVKDLREAKGRRVQALAASCSNAGPQNSRRRA